MYIQEELKGMLFIDIETTSEFETYKEFKSNRPNAIEHWAKKCKQIQNGGEHLEKDDAEMYLHMTALYPEFGKIRVISIGQIQFDESGIPLISKIKSFYGDNESEILKEFLGTMQSIFNAKPNIKLIGHNIKNFDMPFIIKRSIINGLLIPHQFQLQKKKPWENCLLDTYEIWKFAGWSSTSLDLICEVLGLESPKEIMHAVETTSEYWNGNLEKIKEYCEGDVKATMNVMLKISNMQTI